MADPQIAATRGGSLFPRTLPRIAGTRGDPLFPRTPNPEPGTLPRTAVCYHTDVNPTHDMLLTDVERRALNGLWFTAARPVEGLYAGRHRSPLKGHSTEFHDYRPYVAGDALRGVDWKLYGRTDRLYVRRYRHDAELAVHLLVDRSASMDYAGAASPSRPRPRTGMTWLDTDKWRAACKLAAAVAHLVIAQQDRVSLTLLGEQAEPVLPPGSGWEHWRQLCGVLRDTRPVGVSHPASCPAPKLPGVIVLISDLMDDPAAWLRVIGRWVHQHHDVAVFQVLHPDELDLPFDRMNKAIDSETGESVFTGSLTRRAYADRVREHIERLRTGLAGHGVDHQVMRSDQSVIEALARYVSARTATGFVAS